MTQKHHANNTRQAKPYTMGRNDSPQHPKAMSYEAIVITRDALKMKFTGSHTQEEIKNYILTKLKED